MTKRQMVEAIEQFTGSKIEDTLYEIFLLL